MDSYIKTYEPSDAASIAQMWNESDEGWPGGFTPRESPSPRNVYASG